MSDPTDNTDSDQTETETKRLIVAITDFLREQLTVRTDLVPEDRDCLEIAIQSLEMAYNLEGRGYVQYRFSRPLMDIFNQVANPVSVKDKLRADAHKEEGNSYMRRSMFSDAETQYTNAIELDKWNSIYYCNRANARIQQSKYFEAITDCRQALLLNPDYAKAHSRMGQAYALLHRPREAARCFRQALELEPENEKYRHNLTVAENQIDRPDPAQIITNLLASLFGLGRPSSEEQNSRILPTSFMIITESHPPIPDTTPSTGETPQNVNGSQAIQTTNTQTNESSRGGDNGVGNILFPRPYGVIDEGAEEQPILKFEIPPASEPPENSSTSSDEFVTDISFGSFNFGLAPTAQTTEGSNNSANVEKIAEPAEKLQKNVQDDHSEGKTNGQQKVVAEMNVSKNATQTGVGVVEEKETGVKTEDVKEQKTAIESSNTNLIEQQIKTSNKPKEIVTIGNGTSSEVKKDSLKHETSRTKLNIPNVDRETRTKNEGKNNKNDVTSENSKSSRQNDVNSLTAQNKEADEKEIKEKDFTEDVD